jgi:hypothetical protein
MLLAFILKTFAEGGFARKVLSARKVTNIGSALIIL